MENVTRGDLWVSKAGNLLWRGIPAKKFHVGALLKPEIKIVS